MSNKNFNHNDHESFMEGIYGCLERIETAVIENCKRFNQTMVIPLFLMWITRH